MSRTTRTDFLRLNKKDSRGVWLVFAIFGALSLARGAAADEVAGQTPNAPSSLGRRSQSSSPPVRVRGTETFIAEYVGDNGPSSEGLYGDDDNYWAFRNLLYLQAGNNSFDSAIRLDVALFQNPPRLAGYDEFIPGGSGYTLLDYGNDFKLERLHGTIHLGNLHITAGDFYVNFGRGIALSLIKLDDIGVDNALRGGRVEYNLPRRLKVVLVAGVVNALNIDSLTHQIQRDDPLDRIAGGRIEWELLDALSLGAHGVFMKPRFVDETSIESHRLYVDRGTGVGVATGGGSLEAHAGGVHFYVEANGQQHDNYRPPAGQDDVLDENGFASFAEISYDFSPFNIKAEGIVYRKWLMEGPMRGSAPNIGASQPLTYHHMPTLEPMWMIIKSFGNVAGGRVTGDLFLNESDTQIVLSSSLLHYSGGLLPLGNWKDHPATTVVHPVLKIRQGFGETGVSVSAEGGFRYEMTDQPEPPVGGDSGHLWHAQADLSVPLSGPHSIEIKSEVRRHELSVTEGLDEHYWVTLSSVGYDWASVLGLTLVHEFSDQTEGVEASLGDWKLPWPKQHYIWAMASVHAPKPLDSLTVRLFGGSQRGGVKCAGGICRTYPDAVGVKLEAVYRF